MKLVLVLQATGDLLHMQVLALMKHMDVAHLWLQDEVRLNGLVVRWEQHVAHLGTKAPSRAVIARHLDTPDT